MEIGNFEQDLQNRIDNHRAEAERLQSWMDQLTKEGFDWDNVTETQAWVIANYKCANVPESLNKKDQP